MFHNATDCSENSTIDADICIVGAGLAGLSIAREFLGRGERVVVLEGGDSKYSSWSQSLYRGVNVGAPNHDTTFSRFRVYGGSGTRWTGQCVPLQTIDFEQRQWMRHSGWPFDLNHLAPYYRRAGEIFGFGPPGFDLTGWQDKCGKIDPIAGDSLTASIIRFAYPADLGQSLKPELSASTNVHVWLNANVVGFDTYHDEHTRLRAVHVKTRAGRSLRCHARTFILACGGIENARLLLASQDRNPHGLGNEHGLVGRYFMDHPYLTTGYWAPSKKAKAAGLHLIDSFAGVASGRGAHAVFTLSEKLRRNECLNGCVGYFIHRDAWQLSPTYYSTGGQALTRIAECLRGERPINIRLLKSVTEVLSDARHACAALAGSISERRGSSPLLALRMVVEATPRSQSRITLLQEYDALGLPLANIDWQMHENDWRGVTRLRESLAIRIKQAGLGELIDDKQLNAAGWPLSMAGGKHHMGTTRMHVDPHQGVVDSSSRIHGIENMYVAGSSVFPTGGWANPTYTILALAIRLADHLKRQG